MPFAQAQDVFSNLPEGVYFSLSSILKGHADLEPSQLRTGSSRQVKTRAWFRNDSLYVVGADGHIRLFPIDSVYAFVSDGDLYMQRRGLDHKVVLRGELLFFRESYPVRNMAMSPVVMDRNRDQIPRILDTKTGALIEYSVNALDEILKLRDEELHRQFNAISSLKTKRQMIYLYLEKFNERHPVRRSGGQL